MLRDTVSVEVRNKALARIGTIHPQYLNLQLNVRHNNVSEWTVKLPSGHPMSDELRLPGSGIIVTKDGDPLVSGPMVKSTYLATASDPQGSLTFDGVTDDIVLADMLAWPQPSNPNVATQNVQFDTRTGPAETLMHAYVNANIGPGAPAARRKLGLTMGPNLARGQVAAKSARFEVLGLIVSELALPSSLGFEVVQVGDALVFNTRAVMDRTGTVRLDVRNNSLSAQKVSVAAPDVTDIIVIGKGTSPEDVEPIRSLQSYESAQSVEAEAAWGRRIERVVQKRDTQDAAQLQQAADEVLADKGFTAVGVQVTPMEGSTMQFGVDWGLGDRVAVVVDDVEYTSVVTGYKLRIDKDGYFLSADLGDPKNFDPSVALRRKVQQTEQRISALERNG